VLPRSGSCSTSLTSMPSGQPAFGYFFRIGRPWQEDGATPSVNSNSGPVTPGGNHWADKAVRQLAGMAAITRLSSKSRTATSCRATSGPTVTPGVNGANPRARKSIGVSGLLPWLSSRNPFQRELLPLTVNSARGVGSFSICVIIWNRSSGSRCRVWAERSETSG